MKNFCLAMLMTWAFSGALECTEPAFVESYDGNSVVKLVRNATRFTSGNCQPHWIEMSVTRQAKLVFCYDETLPQTCGENCVAFQVTFCSLLNPAPAKVSSSPGPESYQP